MVEHVLIFSNIEMREDKIICRLCTKDHECFVHIFQPNGLNGSAVWKVIQDLLHLIVAVDDGLPEKVCYPCAKKLAEFSEFKEICLKSNAELREMLLNNHVEVPSKEEDPDPGVPLGDLLPTREDQSGEDQSSKAEDPDSASISFEVTHGMEESLHRQCNIPIRKADGLLIGENSEHPIDANVSRGGLEEDATGPGDRSGELSGTEGSSESECDLENAEQSPASSTVVERWNSSSPNENESVSNYDKMVAECLLWKCSVLLSDICKICDGVVSTDWTEASVNVRRQLSGARQQGGEIEQNGRSIAGCDASALSPKKDTVQHAYQLGGNQRKSLKSKKNISIIDKSQDLQSPAHKRKLSRNQVSSEEQLSGIVHFICDSCGIKFSRRRELTIHLAGKACKEKPFKCELCRMEFPQKSYLLDHVVSHTSNNPFQCETCGKMFARKSSVRRHSLIHTGLKPFSCDVCGKKFSLKSSLKYHLYIHTGLKPFKCGTCGNEFRHQSNLLFHMSIHTAIKPYKCESCGKVFSRKHYLMIHLTRHTGLKSFKCETCDKMFSYKSSLVSHLRVHSGAKSSPCFNCGKKFFDDLCLKRHLDRQVCM